jgi:hypothetical protein
VSYSLTISLQVLSDCTHSPRLDAVAERVPNSDASVRPEVMER